MSKKIPNELKINVIERCKDCQFKIEQFVGKPLNSPKITFDQRGKIAGSALLQTNHVRFNPKLLIDNQDEFFSEVIPHEICHIAVFQLLGKVKPHGEEWKALMQNVFSLPGKATHRLDIDSVLGKLYDYACQCSTHKLTIRRHNKAKKGLRYICRSCKSELRCVMRK